MTRYRRELSAFAAWLGLLVVLAIAAPDFFRPGNLRVVLVGFAPTLVAAVGMTLVIVARQIDISVGAVFALCAVVAALLVRLGWPIPLAAAGAVLTGAVVGAANGWFVAVLRLPSIVVTLAMFFILTRRTAAGGDRAIDHDLPCRSVGRARSSGRECGRSSGRPGRCSCWPRGPLITWPLLAVYAWVRRGGRPPRRPAAEAVTFWCSWSWGLAGLAAVLGDSVAVRRSRPAPGWR